MAKYTIEISSMVKDPNFNLFDFEYDFYTDDMNIILNFEKKFIDHYYFSEIGSETVCRFKHMLKSKLNKKMPYWKQLYETELASKDINFLLNKDYRETFLRDVAKENSETGNINTTGKDARVVSDTGNSNVASTGKNTAKVSNIDNGVSEVGLTQGYLTGMSEDKSETNSDATASSNRNDTLDRTGLETSTKNGTGKDKESYVLEGKGNIGTTSSAELLDRWRQVLINLDELIIDECQSLFMLIY